LEDRHDISFGFITLSFILFHSFELFIDFLFNSSSNGLVRLELDIALLVLLMGLLPLLVPATRLEGI
jgi:hypothetical protein